MSQTIDPTMRRWMEQTKSEPSPYVMDDFDKEVANRMREFDEEVSRREKQQKEESDAFDLSVYEKQRAEAKKANAPTSSPVDFSPSEFSTKADKVREPKLRTGEGVPLPSPEQAPIVQPVDEYGIQKPPVVIEREKEEIQKQRVAKLASAISASGGKSYQDYWMERVPFVGPIAAAGSNFVVASAAQRILEGQPTEQDYDSVAAFIKQQKIDNGKGFFDNVGDLITSLPGFAVEFMATSGAFKAGAVAAEAGVGAGAKAFTARLAQRLAAGAAGAATQTLVNPQRIAQAISERRLADSLAVVKDENGEPQYWVKKPDEGFSESAIRGTIGAYFDIATEYMGGDIGKSMKWAGGKLGLDSLTDAIGKYAPRFLSGDKSGAVKAIFHAAHYDGPIPEVAEEVIGSILNSAVGNQPWDQAIPSAQKLGEMYVSFAIPAVAGQMFSRLHPDAQISDVPVTPSRKWVKDTLGFDATLTAEERASIGTAIRTQIANNSGLEVSPEAQAQMDEASQQIRSGEIDLGQQAPAADKLEGTPIAPSNASETGQLLQHPDQAAAVVANQGEQYASEVGQAATVHGDVQQPEGASQGQGQVPANQSGQGVREEEAIAAAPPAVEATTPTEEANRGQVQEETAQADAQGQRQEGLLNLPPGTVGLRRAIVDAQRAARGADPIEQAAVKGFGTLWENAKNRDAADPTYIDSVIADLQSKTRAPLDEQAAALLVGVKKISDAMLQTQEELGQARQQGNSEKVAELEQRYGFLLQQTDALERLRRDTGTDFGRGLNAYKLIAARDWSLVNLITRKQASLGRPLTEEEHASVAALTKEINDLRSRIDALENAKAVPEIDALIEGGKKERSQRQTKARADLNKAWADFSKVATGKLFANPFDPELLTSAVNLASAYVKLGVAKVQDFYDRVAQRTGKPLTPEAKKTLWQAWAIATSREQNARTEKIAKAIDRLKVEGIEPESIRDLTRTIALEGVRSGDVNSRDEAVDYVTRELADSLGLSREDVAHAISGIGIYKMPTEDEAKKKLIGWQSELQQLEKLRYMASGEAPPPTGQQRLEQTDEYRRLTKQVNEAKKKGGFTVTDPARQLRTAIDAIITRLEHEIADLNHEIETGQRIVKQKNPTPSEPRIDALRAQRDELKKRRDELLPRPGISDKQRLAMALASADKTIAELERRIKERDFFPLKKAGKPAVTSPELESKKAQIDYLRDLYGELKTLAKPKVSQEERENAAYQSRVRKRIAELQRRLVHGDFSKKPKQPPRQLNEQSLQLQLQERRLKQQFLRGLEADERSKRTVVQKVFGVFGDAIDFARVIKLGLEFSPMLLQGGFEAFGHPLQAVYRTGKMFRAFASQDAFDKLQIELENNPLVKSGLTRRAKLALVEHDAVFNQHEEFYLSRWLERVPGARNFDRGTTTLMNWLRLERFAQMIAADGGSMGVTEEQAKIIANAVNIWSGRGDLGKWRAGIQAYTKVFLAPAWVVSRFQTALGYPLWRGDSVTRKKIAAEYARTLSGLAATYSAIALAKAMYGGDDPFYIELDPRSSDFGKLVIGNTRYDFLFGLSQATVFLARLVTGEVKRQTGEVVAMRDRILPFDATAPLRDKNEPTPRVDSSVGFDTITQFLRYKASPVAEGTIELLTGKNAVGDKVPPWFVPINMGIPVTMQSIYESISDLGIPGAMVGAIPAMFGVNPGTYKTNPDSFLGAERRLSPNAFKKTLGRVTASGSVTMKDGETLTPDEFAIQAYGRLLDDLTAPFPEKGKRTQENIDEWQSKVDNARRLLNNLGVDESELERMLNMYLLDKKRTRGYRRERRSELRKSGVGQ